ncbi:hypothetical protein HYDPIDRAFT_40828 [Hydnomerulius pinastri MD-312]|uniref:DUF7330 domain-containing protein n=1 Tax=Hydnomerulius pinastri MD-312 TaxID=994086 RepID=A0A0C9WEB6_9AGAM|nr:hypothetical protein HYDPIDRAFT_40828 [Hydnomerulius pinastri MD-312]
MIIAPEEKLRDSMSKNNLSNPSQTSPEVAVQDPPPIYPTPAPMATPNAVVIPHPTFKTEPNNFIEVSHDNGHIRGEFVVDPSLRVPSSLLPPLAFGESEANRQNLRLYTKNGHIDVDVGLVGQSSGNAFAGTPMRTSLHMSPNNETVHVRVHAVQGAGPFVLTVATASFLSRAALAHATPFTKIDNVKRFFVGDVSQMNQQGWNGDELRVDVGNGHIRIKYVGESDKLGFLRRLFGH